MVRLSFDDAIPTLLPTQRESTGHLPELLSIRLAPKRSIQRASHSYDYHHAVFHHERNGAEQFDTVANFSSCSDGVIEGQKTFGNHTCVVPISGVFKKAQTFLLRHSMIKVPPKPLVLVRSSVRWKKFVVRYYAREGVSKL